LRRPVRERIKPSTGENRSSDEIRQLLTNEQFN
jgi:hypothetical protein